MHPLEAIVVHAILHFDGRTFRAQIKDHDRMRAADSASVDIV